MAKKQEVMAQPSPEVLAQLQSAYPVEQSALRIILPRLSMVSQDVTEGKGKAMKVVTEAGTFFEEFQTDEIDETTGKKVWDKTELGTTIEGIIVFKRKQLRYYDADNNTFTSSPIYDTDNESVPLFCNKKEIARGTPAELKARPEYVYEDPKTKKTKSRLEENRVIYVLRAGQLYQLNLRGSSMYSLMSYERQTNVPTVLTEFSSEAMENGSIAWNKMTFKVLRTLSAEEADEVAKQQTRLITAVQAEKASYVSQEKKAEEDDKELDEMVAGAMKALGGK